MKDIKSRLFSNERSKKETIVLIIILLLLTCFFLFPFVMLLSRSFMSIEESVSYEVTLLPKSFTLDAFKEAINGDFLMYAKNSLIVIIVNVIGIPLVAYCGAYAFARVKFVGRDIWFAIALSTIMLPGIVAQIPLYKVFSDLKWTETLLPLTIPGLFGGGVLNIFLMRQFLKSIPKDYDEAAKIDGANTFKLMFQIMLPMVKPVFLLVMVNTFLGVWNDFNGPLIFITNPEKYTLPLGVFSRFQFAQTDYEAMPNVQMASGLMMMIPPIIAFVVFQKQLIEGVSLGGLKG